MLAVLFCRPPAADVAIVATPIIRQHSAAAPVSWQKGKCIGDFSAVTLLGAFSAWLLVCLRAVLQLTVLALSVCSAMTQISEVQHRRARRVLRGSALHQPEAYR
jgi:hypothetical protein